MNFNLNALKWTSLFALAASLNACGTTVVQAANNPDVEGIVVSGVGKASGSPDMARATIGVETRARTAEQATADTNSRMTALSQAFKQLGILDADLKTQNFSVNFEQDFQPQPPPPVSEPAAVASKSGKASTASSAPPAAPPKDEPRGWYRAANTLEVTVRDLKQLGKILGTATTLGSNAIYGVNFELSDPHALEAQAREKAVADARARAEQLARLSGITLGAVLAVSESTNFPGPMQGPMMMAKSESLRADAAPVESGQLEVTAQVSVRYAIERSGK